MGHGDHTRNTYSISDPYTIIHQAFSLFSSSRLSSPLPKLQFHQLFGIRTSPGGADPGTPMGCSSAQPQAGILLQSPKQCEQRCRSSDSWECEWGSGFAEARPPQTGGKSEGMGRWAQKGSTPARGIFRVGPLRKGWGPLPGDWHVWHHCWHVKRGNLLSLVPRGIPA